MKRVVVIIDYYYKWLQKFITFLKHFTCFQILGFRYKYLEPQISAKITIIN